MAFVWEVVADNSLKKLCAKYPDLEYFVQLFFAQNVYPNIKNHRECPTLTHDELQTMALLFYTVDQPEHTFYILDYVLDVYHELDIVDCYLYVQSSWQVLSEKDEVVLCVKEAQSTVSKITPQNEVEEYLKNEILAIGVNEDSLFESSEYYPYYTNCKAFDKKKEDRSLSNMKCEPYKIDFDDGIDYERLKQVLVATLDGSCSVGDMLIITLEEQERCSKKLTHQVLVSLMEAYCEVNSSICEKLKKDADADSCAMSDDEFDAYMAGKKMTSKEYADYEIMIILRGYIASGASWDEAAKKLQYVWYLYVYEKIRKIAKEDSDNSAVGEMIASLQKSLPQNPHIKSVILKSTRAAAIYAVASVAGVANAGVAINIIFTSSTDEVYEAIKLKFKAFENPKSFKEFKKSPNVGIM